MYKINFVFLAIALTFANAMIYDETFHAEWSEFKLEHEKEYKNPTEEEFRQKIFYENKLYVADHNQRYFAGEVTYKLAINQYADLLSEEYAEMLLGFNTTQAKELLGKGASFITPAYLNAPPTIDWRTKGAVTAVKNQGQCGSCWAFSSTGSLEGQHFRKTGKLVSLSEQNLVDCSRNYGNNGCNGGFMSNAFRYIKDNRGIDTEISYPYEGTDSKCRYKPNSIGATVSNHVELPQGNEQAMLEAVAAHGPVSVAINSSPKSFQLYHSGVYNEANCDPNGINHAVLVVGYGNEGNQNYWLVKNSWATTWGDKGYIKMARGRNLCGIALYGMYPLV